MPHASDPLNTVGELYQDFKITKVLPIPELNCVLKELEHLPTGAQVIHIENDDSENLFCLSFQTLPASSNGVAHILEHTVLCGSEKFPVKDPFFGMSRRSLNTFMNALTGSDFTCYPASTQVPKDFYNLLEVYLDATFRPNLNELSFMQEGHRLELSDPKNLNSSLEFKGVVYNEMKGALNSSTTRLIEAMNAALFPNVSYGYNSGGDPRIIPQLTYQELKDFHALYYHPSHCLFFFYGNMPLDKHLDFIADHALKGVKKIAPLPPIPDQPRFSEPKYLQLTYPASPQDMSEDNVIIGFGWLTCHILHQEDWLALSILDIILIDTDASPLKKALLKSGLCKQVSGYVDNEINEIPLMLILKGCRAENAEPLQELIKSTLQKVIEEGIQSEKINSAIHQLEIHRSEITGDHAPFGLSLFMRSALLRQHGGKIEDGLRIHSIFDAFQKKVVEDPGYLPSLIQQYFLENPHFVRIVMVPDENLGSKEAAEERRVLDELHKQLLPEQLQSIVDKSIALEKFQKAQEEEDVSVLPKVGLEDIPKESRDYPLTHITLGNLEIFSHTCFTNNIVYVDLVFDLPDIAEKDLPFVRLFAAIMSQVGCENRDYSENLDYIQAHTGGVGVSLTFNLQAQNSHQFKPSISIRGKSLYRKAFYLFSLIYEMATSIDLTDVARIKEIVLKHYTGLQASLNQSGLKYAINLSASGLDVASKIAEDWYGISYFETIREIAQDIDQQIERLIFILQRLKQTILCVGKPHLVIACDEQFYNELVQNKFWGLSDLPILEMPAWKGNYPLQKTPSQGRVIASPVAFNAKVFKTVSYVHPDAPALSLAAFIFDNLTLHSRIREKGGAYGAGAVNNSLSGNFYFYSYRDPHIASTLDAFHEAIQDVIRGDFDDEDLEEAKMELIQSMDGPISPGSRADLAYGWLREGKSLEIRQTFRDRMLSVTTKDIQAAVQRHIVPHFEEGALVSFADQALLEKENALLKQPLQILPV